MATRRSARLAGRTTESMETPQPKRAKPTDIVDTGASASRGDIFFSPMIVLACDDGFESNGVVQELEKTLEAYKYKACAIAMDTGEYNLDTAVPPYLLMRAMHHVRPERPARAVAIVTLRGADDDIGAMLCALEAAHDLGLTVMDFRRECGSHGRRELQNKTTKCMFAHMHYGADYSAEVEPGERRPYKHIYDSDMVVRDTIARCHNMLPMVSITDISDERLMRKIRFEWSADRKANQTHKTRAEALGSASTDICRTIFVKRRGSTAVMLGEPLKWDYFDGCQYMLFSDPVCPWDKLLHWFPDLVGVRKHLQMTRRGPYRTPIYAVLSRGYHDNNFTIGLGMNYKSDAFSIWMRAEGPKEIAPSTREAILLLVAVLFADRPDLWRESSADKTKRPNTRSKPAAAAED